MYVITAGSYTIHVYVAHTIILTSFYSANTAQVTCCPVQYGRERAWSREETEDHEEDTPVRLGTEGGSYPGASRHAL